MILNTSFLVSIIKCFWMRSMAVSTLVLASCIMSMYLPDLKNPNQDSLDLSTPLMAVCSTSIPATACCAHCTSSCRFNGSKSAGKGFGTDCRMMGIKVSAAQSVEGQPHVYIDD